tara:strand:- start:13880 stop:15541 length:1662 start_codon:yes stop_codon:yes gene_type:complete
LSNTNQVIFVSDFFVHEILGGAEKCNDALINKLNKKYNIFSINSRDVTIDFIKSNKNNLFIVANFFMLQKDVKLFLSQNVKYIIYEHDHKYVSTNNPLPFKNFLAPQEYIINKDFYSAAHKVVCQSKMHAEVVYKNLLLDNIINAGGNFWSDEDISILEEHIGKNKTISYACMNTQNKNKGTPVAIRYCMQNNYDLTLLDHKAYGNFIQDLARAENFVFFPQWLESYSRVAVEAKILGCKIITNGLLGVASEDYFKLDGFDLLTKIKENNKLLLQTIDNIIEGKPVEDNFVKKKIPKITISCPVYNGDKYIKHFLEDITKQTIFANCELIIINANSPGNEEDIIAEYCNRYSNIIYKRLDYRATTTETINMVISELATGKYITVGNIDDCRSYDCLENQARELMFDEEISLVYGDCLQTTKINETFEENTSNGVLYEHSLNSFSRENMIKCLPGPMPMWKIDAHKEIGLFSDKYDYANDWDMWLRMVQAGRKFKKINKPLGLYYFNPEGRSTSVGSFQSKIKEEADIFFKYKNIFGENNFKKYKNHFSQGLLK